MINRLLILPAVMVLIACASATSATRDVSPGQQIALRVGESVRVSNQPVSLRLASISDSRCPSDVQCIVAGEALIVIQFSGSGDRTDTLRLVGQPRTVAYAGFQFDVESVLPYPTSASVAAAKTLTLEVR